MYKRTRAFAFALSGIAGSIVLAGFFFFGGPALDRGIARADSAAAVQWSEQLGGGEIFAACASSNTGTWTYAADCPTACGTNQTTQTQVCTGGSGTCDGTASSRTCSATAACPDQSCTTSNACGSNSGTIVNGVCNAAQPAIPSNYGASCYTATNSCGGTNSGTIGCDATCQLTQTLPPPDPSWLRTPCSVSNSCGMSNSGVLWCSGACENPTTGAAITAPSESLCPPTACTAPQVWDGTKCITPTCTGAQCCVAETGSSCSSQANSCGQVGYGKIACSGACDAVKPADNSCPQTCTDPSATNYGGSLPCTYTQSRPVDASLSASPSSVSPGERAQLSWGSSNATSCSAGGAWSNGGSLSGSGLTDPLYANTTFTFQCTGPGGTSPLRTATVSVTAVNPPGGCSVTPPSNAIDPTYCCDQPGFYWDVFGYCVTDTMRGPVPDVTAETGVMHPNFPDNPSYENWRNTRHVSYRTSIDGLRFSSLYTTTDYGQTFCKEYVSIGDAVSWGPAVGTFYPGMWGVSQSWGASGPYTQTQRWKFVCENGWGTGEGIASLIVCPASNPTWVPILNRYGQDTGEGSCGGGISATLTATPSTITAGQSSKLTWTSSNAVSCTSAGGFSTGGAVSNASGVSVSPATTSSYQITCTNASGGSAQSVATVTVVQPAVTLSANPVRVQAGKTTTIAWSSTDVTSCAITRNGAAWKSGLSSPGVLDTITGQTTYVLTCQTIGAPITKSVVVNVATNFQEF